MLFGRRAYDRTLEPAAQPIANVIAPLTDEEKREIADMDAAYNAHQDTRETVATVIWDIIYDERLDTKDGDAYDLLLDYALRIRKARDD